MDFTNDQQIELQDTIRRAYNLSELIQLVRKYMSEDLRSLVPTESPFSQVISDLIGAYQRRGELDKLIEAIGQDRPNNQAVLDAISRLRKAVGRQVVPFDCKSEGAVAKDTSPLPDAQFDREVRSALRAGDLDRRLMWDAREDADRLITALVQEMERRGFSAADRTATRIALKELLTNGRHTSGTHVRVRVALLESEVVMCVEDEGGGFDWESILARLTTELESGGNEHGLLRAARYGNSLYQLFQPHRVFWRRARHPDTLSCVFDGTKGVVPVVFDYEGELLRIVDEIGPWLGTSLSVAHRDITLDPLRRSPAGVIGIEVRGRHGSYAAPRMLPSVELSQAVLDYVRRRCPAKWVVIFANAEHEDNRSLAALCRSDERGAAAFFDTWGDCAAAIATYLTAPSGGTEDAAHLGS
jgi:hypothetical protein